MCVYTAYPQVHGVSQIKISSLHHDVSWPLVVSALAQHVPFFQSRAPPVPWQLMDHWTPPIPGFSNFWIKNPQTSAAGWPFRNLYPRLPPRKERFSMAKRSSALSLLLVPWPRNDSMRQDDPPHVLLSNGSVLKWGVHQNHPDLVIINGNIFLENLRMTIWNEIQLLQVRKIPSCCSTVLRVLSLG